MKRSTQNRWAGLKRIVAVFLMTVLFAFAAEFVFEDHFDGKLADGWSWIRENRGAWRVKDGALEIHVQPGNLWGGANDAKNVLVRPAPDAARGGIEISVTVENKPIGQYEQANLAWYYDDSHMVKLGQEMVDGKVSIVMGREEGDKTRTIAIIPLNAAKVQLRFLVKGNIIRGEFRTADSERWREAGSCDLPVHGEPKISLHAYQGLPNVEHWARFSNFRIARPDQ